MQIAVDLESIKNRAAALRLSPSHLARAAGKTPSLVCAAFKPGSNPTVRTVNALDEALSKEERKVLEHLLARFDRADLAAQIFAPEGKAVAA